jgi:6-phosphogluconolactonase
MMECFDDPESLSRAAADLFVQEAITAVAERGLFTVALSGGHTPSPTYRHLATSPWRDQTPWDKIHVFWGDERCVPITDACSNARMAYETLLNHVPVNPDHVHPIRCSGDPKSGGNRYEQLLQAQLPANTPALDLVFLGLGQNGHTASLFPYSPALEEKSRWAMDVYVDEQHLYRVTLTPTLINAARTVVFLVTGLEKAEVLRLVLMGPRDYRKLPAQRIDPKRGRLIWMVDRAAASQLDGKRLV